MRRAVNEDDDKSAAPGRTRLRGRGTSSCCTSEVGPLFSSFFLPLERRSVEEEDALVAAAAAPPPATAAFDSGRAGGELIVGTGTARSSRTLRIRLLLL